MCVDRSARVDRKSKFLLLLLLGPKMKLIKHGLLYIYYFLGNVYNFVEQVPLGSISISKQLLALQMEDRDKCGEQVYFFSCCCPDLYIFVINFTNRKWQTRQKFFIILLYVGSCICVKSYSISFGTIPCYSPSVWFKLIIHI